MDDQQNQCQMEMIFMEQDWIIIVYNIMQKKSGQTSNLYLQISLFLNFIIIVGIIVYILKRKNLSPMPTPFASVKTSRVLKCQNILMPTIENFNDSKTQKKQQIHISNQILSKSDQARTMIKQNFQNDDKSKQKEDSIAILQDQLYFERQRNEFLQAQQEQLKQQLRRFQQQIGKQQSPQYTNLKNQLQFCQKKLRQSSEIEIELRKKIEDYERISILMLDHPEYERLRQLNNQYKDTIRNLQAKLLQRNGNKNEYLELSFNYL